MTISGTNTLWQQNIECLVNMIIFWKLNIKIWQVGINIWQVDTINWQVAKISDKWWQIHATVESSACTDTANFSRGVQRIIVFAAPPPLLRSAHAVWISYRMKLTPFLYELFLVDLQIVDIQQSKNHKTLQKYSKTRLYRNNCRKWIMWYISTC